MYSRVLVLVLTLLLLTGGSAADKKGPRAFHVGTYPARDVHDMEKVGIAADPYDMPDKAKTAFEVPYKDLGFLPIQLIISNDGENPITLVDMEVQLITVDRVKISPATYDDFQRRLAKGPGRPDEQSKSPLPFPIGKKKNIAKLAKEEMEEMGLNVIAVEPKTTHGGFVFFDVKGLKNPLAGATLLITGLQDSEGGELFYFEIPLEKYLSYRPPSSSQ